MKHTEGKLRAENYDGKICLEICSNKEDAGFVMADLVRIFKFLGDANGKEKDEALTLANAQRLVACWNACEGIPTETLGGLDLKKTLDQEREIKGELLKTMRFLESCDNDIIRTLAKEAIQRAEEGDRKPVKDRQTLELEGQLNNCRLAFAQLQGVVEAFEEQTRGSGGSRLADKIHTILERAIALRDKEIKP